MASNNDPGILKAAEQIWGMLDAMAAKDPQEYKKFVEKQMEEGKEYLASPVFAFCLKCPKTRHKGKECTLYINVCSWNRVPYPPTDNDPIPVKGGTLRHHLNDKRKRTQNSELLYELAFNPRVTKECSKDLLMFEMLKNLSLDFTEDTLSVHTNREAVTKS
ncbi:PREDICTED: PIH1 domain-containing protein 2-like, partial [Amphimedon queenslandica]|uniref:PIH1 N-terminal domain-containing protein n=2 Tax=Amphimedon queenslandica TaxID=400682 RepID=A0AAN0ITT0_AMPQE